MAKSCGALFLLALIVLSMLQTMVTSLIFSSSMLENIEDDIFDFFPYEQDLR